MVIARCLTLVLVLSAVSCKKDEKKSESADNTSNTAATTASASGAPAQAPPAIAIDAAPIAATDAAAPAKEAAGPYLYLRRGGMLQEVRADGSTKDLGPFDEGGWCEVDAEAQVVWSLGTSGLQAMDLTDGTLHTVIAPGPGLEEVEIRYPVGPAVGVVDGLQTDTALIVNISEIPNLKPEVVCDGDRQYYCYDNMDNQDESKWPLGQEAKNSLAAYKKFKLADREFLVALAARSKTRGSGQVEIQEPTPPKVAVAKEPCQVNPDDCGKATYLGGQRFWSVITENDRGDYYYEDSQLYDSQKEEFVDFAKGTRSKTPFAEGGDVSMWLSKDRAYAMTYEGKLIDLATASVVKEFKDAKPCGWR